MDRNSPEVPFLQYVRGALGVDPSGPPDGELLERFAKRGDHGAFELLVWRHAALVQGVCRHVLRDHHAAEDASQAVFLALARNAGSFDVRRGVVGWLHVVARRIALNAARRSKATRQMVSDLSETPALIRESDAEVTKSLHEEVARLPEKYRLPVLLCYFEGLSHLEAAQRLAWPLGSVNSRLTRAKELLLQRLTKRGVASAMFPALCAATCTRAATPAFVAIVVRASPIYAHGGSVVPFVSPTTYALANGVSRTMFLSKLRLIASVTTVSGLLLGGVAVLAAEPVAPPTPSIAAVPQSQVEITPGGEKKVKLDPKIVEAYEKTGAVYGGFVKLETVRKGVKVPTIAFQPGRDAAEKGEYIGFKWSHLESGDIPKLPVIEADIGVILDETQVSDAGVKELAISLKGLLSISLDDCKRVTDASTKELAGCKKLVSINLTETATTDKGLKNLVPLADQLEYLALNETKVTDAGIKELAPMKKLATLMIEDTAVTDAGLKELRALKSLAVVDLAKTRITDAGLKELAEMKNLVMVVVADCREVSKKGVDALQKALPECIIIFEKSDN